MEYRTIKRSSTSRTGRQGFKDGLGDIPKRRYAQIPSGINRSKISNR